MPLRKIEVLLLKALKALLLTLPLIVNPNMRTALKARSDAAYIHTII